MIDMKVHSFFDTKAVRRAVDRAQRQVLSKAGAFVRTVARSSIRSRKRISRPGEPPSSHKGTLKKLLFFAYDRSNDSVVVGPLDFRARDGSTGGASRLEFGGSVRRDGQTQRYRPRPFMLPAMEKEAPKFPQLWKNQVKA